MKHTKKLILCAICAALLLSLGACGKTDSGITGDILISAMEAGGAQGCLLL